MNELEMKTDLVHYYRERALEYEQLYYTKSERQADLSQISEMLKDTFRNKNVLEIACGTGYWTERIAQTAKHITATDINRAMLDIAESRDYERKNSVFAIEDIFNFKQEQLFDGLFGGFIWSHILLKDLEKFADICLEKVGNGGVLLFTDNKYVPGSSSPIYETDADGNTYQVRKLENGTPFKVLKNFPTKEQLGTLWKDRVSGFEYFETDYYWILRLVRNY